MNSNKSDFRDVFEGLLKSLQLGQYMDAVYAAVASSVAETIGVYNFGFSGPWM